MPSPDVIRVVCGKCGAKLGAPPSHAGKSAQCRKCGNLMTVPAPPQAVHAPPPPEPIFEAEVLEPDFLEPEDEPPRESRRVLVECPNCGSELDVKKSEIGRKMDCPRCDQRVRIPEPVRRRPGKKTSSPWFLVSLIAGGVLLLALSIWGVVELVNRSGPSVPALVVKPGQEVKLNAASSLRAQDSTLCIIVIKDESMLQADPKESPRLKWSNGDITEMSRGNITALFSDGSKKVIRQELIFRATETGARPRWLLYGDLKIRCRILSEKEFEDETR
ncbi:MAG: hypothetical protein U0791_06635 [Gemmataceae bacterium]